MPHMLKIGELASKSGLSRDAIRFYEREALLPKAPRTQAGYRLYSAEALEQLSFIQQAQALGLSLAEIRELLSGYHDTEECRQVKRLLEQKIAALDERLRGIHALRARLCRYLTACHQALRDGPAAPACPVLTILRDHEGQAPAGRRRPVREGSRGAGQAGTACQQENDHG